MTTKGEALQSFFSSFGMTAFPSSAVPDDVTFPFITYESILGVAGEQISMTASLWFKTESEAVPNAKAEEVAYSIGRGGKQIAYDGGSIWIKRGTPFCTALADESDSSIKRRILNLEIEFL